MKCYAGVFVLVVTCYAAADDAPLKKIVKQRVEEINNAVIKGDFAKIADLTHPAVVELMGGRKKMISDMESLTKEMKSQGFAFKSVKVDDPSDPAVAGNNLYLVVPFALEMTAPGGKLHQKSFVIGVSSDKGKSWTFVNGGNQDLKTLKKILPDLPEKLTLPEKEKPVFEKD